MEDIDKVQIANLKPEETTNGLLQKIYPAKKALNIPSKNSVKVVCLKSPDPLIKWLIAHGTREYITHRSDDPNHPDAITIEICNLQALGVSDELSRNEYKDSWEERKTQLENLLQYQNYVIQITVNHICVTLPQDDLNIEELVDFISQLQAQRLLVKYTRMRVGTDFQLIAEAPSVPDNDQKELMIEFAKWLARKTCYYYHTH